jgi:hypothetical protein
MKKHEKFRGDCACPDEIRYGHFLKKLKALPLHPDISRAQVEAVSFDQNRSFVALRLKDNQHNQFIFSNVFIFMSHDGTV